MPLDPTVAALLQFMESANLPALSDGTPAQAREAIRNLMVTMVDPATRIEVGSVQDVTIAGLGARTYAPNGAGSGATVVYLHGGGFVIGDLDTHDGVCRRLCAETGAVVASIDYRLAPEHHFPAAVEDCYAALGDVAKNIDSYGGDASRLVVGGDSAGGNLAAVCAQFARNDGLALAAQLLIYPAVDLLGEYPSRSENATGYFLTEADMRWFAENYVGTDETGPAAALAVDPRLSPLHATDLTGLAPAVVVTAEFDPLRDEGDRYAELLTAAGVKVAHRQFAGLIHGFYGVDLFGPAAVEATQWANAQLAALL